MSWTIAVLGCLAGSWSSSSDCRLRGRGSGSGDAVGEFAGGVSIHHGRKDRKKMLESLPITRRLAQDLASPPPGIASSALRDSLECPAGGKPIPVANTSACTPQFPFLEM